MELKEAFERVREYLGLLIEKLVLNMVLLNRISLRTTM